MFFRNQIKLKGLPAVFLLFLILLDGCGYVTISKINNGSILQKALTQSGQIRNSNVDLTANLLIKSGNQTIASEASTHGQMSIRPIFLHQHFSARINDKVLPQVEAYMDEKNIYAKLNLSPSASWTKADLSQSEKNVDVQLIKESFKQMEDEVLIRFPKDLVKTGTVIQKGNDYLISFTYSETAVKKFAKRIAFIYIGNPLAQMIGSAIDQMKITKFDSAYTIDKKTFYPKAYRTAVKMTGVENEQSIDISMSVSGNFSAINQLKDLSIPGNVRTAP